MESHAGMNSGKTGLRGWAAEVDCMEHREGNKPTVAVTGARDWTGEVDVEQETRGLVVCMGCWSSAMQSVTWKRPRGRRCRRLGRSLALHERKKRKLAAGLVADPARGKRNHLGLRG